MEIYYNPDDYNDFYVAEEKSPKTLGTIFTIVGIIALFMAIAPIILILGFNVL